MKKSIIITIVLFFFACDFENNNSINDPNFKRDNFGSMRSQLSCDLSTESVYPIEVSTDSRWIRKDDCYQAVFLGFGDTKSAFYLEKGALIPPQETPEKAKVKITCIAEKISNKEIIFTFGPHGTVFDPPATMIMDFTALIKTGESCTNELPRVYYIEDDGTYTEQPIDFVNDDEKWLELKISHFSRYAMSYGK